jgi:hypothetical protein
MHLKTPFRLLIGFINHLEVVTTVNYNTVTDLHNLHSLHFNLFSLSAIVFIAHSLDHTLQIKPSICTINLHTANLLYSASLASTTRSIVDLFEASGIHSETANH